METQHLPKMIEFIKSLLFSALRQRQLLNAKSAVTAVLALLTLASPIAYANVTAVNVTPSSIGVSAQGATIINARWQVKRLETIGFSINVGGTSTIVPIPVSSPSAQLQINGQTIATLGGPVSKNSAIKINKTATLIFNETFVINAALARRIAESPAGNLRIVRTFADLQPAGAAINVPGFIQLVPGSATGPLTVRRIDLSFENKARTDVVYKNESIRAYVDVSFRSSGILRGEWRLVDPTATLGASGGRVLQVVQKSLVSSGNGRTRIVSPPLPTNENGLYLLAFSVQTTDAALETPVLRYFVLEKNHIPPAAHIGEVDVISPKSNAPLTKDTVFAWQTFEGAEAYQVEVFNKNDDVAISGKLIPASIAKLSLSSFSLDSLLPGYEYHWKIRAFNSQGKVVGESEPRILHMPQ